MATTNATQENFESLIKDNEIVLVDFWAEWCGPCKKFSPIFEASSEKHTDVQFAKVDTETEHSLAAGANIQSIPTILAIKNGRLVFSHSGVISGKQIDNIIEQVKAL